MAAGSGERVSSDWYRSVKGKSSSDLRSLSKMGLSDQRVAAINTILRSRAAGQEVGESQLIQQHQETTSVAEARDIKATAGASYEEIVRLRRLDPQTREGEVQRLITKAPAPERQVVTFGVSEAPTNVFGMTGTPSQQLFGDISAPSTVQVSRLPSAPIHTVERVPSAWERIKEKPVGTSLNIFQEQTAKLIEQSEQKGFLKQDPGRTYGSATLQKIGPAAARVAPYFIPWVGEALLVGEGIEAYATKKGRADVKATSERWGETQGVLGKATAYVAPVAEVVLGAYGLKSRTITKFEKAEVKAFEQAPTFVTGTRFEGSKGGIDILKGVKRTPSTKYVTDIELGFVKAGKDRVIIEQGGGTAFSMGNFKVKGAVSAFETGGVYESLGAVPKVKSAGAGLKTEKALEGYQSGVGRIYVKEKAKGALSYKYAIEPISGQRFLDINLDIAKVSTPKKYKTFMGIGKDTETGDILFRGAEVKKLKVPKGTGEYIVPMRKPVVSYEQIGKPSKKGFQVEGYFEPGKGRVVVEKDLPFFQKRKILKHELGHYEQSAFGLTKESKLLKDEELFRKAALHLEKKYKYNIPYKEERFIGEYLADMYKGKTPTTKIKVLPTAGKVSEQPTIFGKIKRYTPTEDKGFKVISASTVKKPSITTSTTSLDKALQRQTQVLKGKPTYKSPMGTQSVVEAGLETVKPVVISRPSYVGGLGGAASRGLWYGQGGLITGDAVYSPTITPIAAPRITPATTLGASMTIPTTTPFVSSRFYDLPKGRLSTGLKFETGVREGVKQRDLLKEEQVSKQRVLQREVLGVKERLLQKQLLKTSTPTGFPGMRPILGGGFLPIIPFALPKGKMYRKKLKQPKATRPYKYQPSLGAIGFKIKRTKIPTGLSKVLLRPIIIQKKKKKKRRK